MKTKKSSFGPSLLVSLSLLLGSCQKQKSAKQMLEGRWILVELGELEKERLLKSGAYMDLSNLSEAKETSHQNAFMGCNRMFFQMEILPENKVSFSEIGSTMMYCGDKMEIERKFQEQLPTMTRYELQGRELSLQNEKGDRMIFTAEEERRPL